ncbi:MAG: DUF423 domain-containing protein, partial [Gammaproteobacteria bacterium]
MVFAGLCGAVGIALSATAAHSPGREQLWSAATMCLVHAPVFVAVAAIEWRAGRMKIMPIAAAAIALGVVLFCADVTLKALFGARLFPMAAPI